MKNAYSFLTLLIFLLCTCTTHAEKKLTPIDDTYVYSNNTIRGMEETFKTYHSTSGNQFRRVSFLKFEIATLSPFIESAKLRLYTDGFSAGGDKAHQFDLYPVTIDSWSEDDITFNNYKEKVGEDVASPILASYIVAAGQALSPQYIEFSGNNLTQLITEAVASGKRYISFRLREKNVVKNGANAVIVDFHSKEHSSGFSPELVVEERNTELYRLSDIKMDNSNLVDFSEEKYHYTVRLPWDATIIPTISATAKYTEASVSIKQATSLTATENERTAAITVTNSGESIKYSVLFELLPPPTDASLLNIQFGEKDIEFFAPNKYTYTVYLPYSEDLIPQITATTNDPNASYQITQATKIKPTESEALRTATITTTSANSEVKETYKIIFEQLPELDIIIAIGQSNMAGRAPFAAYQDPMKDIFLLTPENGMEVSSNPMNKYSNIRKDLSIQGLSPTYTCALDVQKFTKNKIAFVVNAQGGSAISAWNQPGKSNYDATIKRAKEAQKYGKIRAIIWHQGESDKGQAANDNYVAYKSNLAKMVNHFRTDLNEPDLYFVCGELSQNEDRKEFNEEVIQKVSTFINNADFISTEGTYLLADNIHFDAASVKVMGERYATKLIGKLYSTTSSINQNKKNKKPFITAINGGIKVNNTDKKTNCVIYNISGVAIEKNVIEADEYIPLEKGFYLVTLHQNDYVKTEKVIIP